MLLGPTKTIDLFVGPINGPKTISLGRIKSDSAGYKKPVTCCDYGLFSLSWIALEKSLVELAGVEPASEIPTSSVLHA